VTAGAAEATAAVKAARTRSSARSETVRYPSMVVTAEGTGVRPVHAAAGNRSRAEATAACETTRMTELAWPAKPTMIKLAGMAKPTGATMAPESRTV